MSKVHLYLMKVAVHVTLPPDAHWTHFPDHLIH